MIRPVEAERRFGRIPQHDVLNLGESYAVRSYLNNLKDHAVEGHRSLLWNPRARAARDPVA